jgi:hypothetical protein
LELRPCDHYARALPASQRTARIVPDFSLPFTVVGHEITPVSIAFIGGAQNDEAAFGGGLIDADEQI